MNILPEPPPYHLVLFPRTDSSIENQIASVDLANSISRIGKSEIYNTEVINFGYDYDIFLEEITFEDDQKNKIFFIDLFKNKIFKPGIITFIANFDIIDLSLMMTQFEVHKSDLKVLLIVIESEFEKWKSDEKVKNIDYCIHKEFSNKCIMEKLRLTTESY